MACRCSPTPASLPRLFVTSAAMIPHFLNTAFTTNVFRGLLLWVVSCVIAYPMANFYHQPALAQLLPATGLTALVHGFVSTAMYTRRRHMDFKRLAILDLANETVTFAVLVIWAYFYPETFGQWWVER